MLPVGLFGRANFTAANLETFVVYAGLGVPLITNVMGSTEGEFAALVERVAERDEVAAIELNVSCPNVATGLDIGADPAGVLSLLAVLRPLTRKPLIVIVRGTLAPG